MNLTAVQHEFACPCGYGRPVTVPAKIALAAWLTDYPCPGCGYVVYPSVDHQRPSGGDQHGADDAAADIEFADADDICPGCGSAGAGFCATCALPRGPQP